jgi:hypothetical protein
MKSPATFRRFRYLSQSYTRCVSSSSALNVIPLKNITLAKNFLPKDLFLPGFQIKKLLHFSFPPTTYPSFISFRHFIARITFHIDEIF